MTITVGDGRVHPKIIEFVENSLGVFDDPVANPRAWTSASQLLRTWESGTRDPALLASALTGVLGEAWARGFIHFYQDACGPLQPAEIIEAYPAYHASVCIWVQQGRLDMVVATLELLQDHLQRPPLANVIEEKMSYRTNLEAFFADLPTDLQLEVKTWLDLQEFPALIVPAPARSTRP